jgi:hypothetical protein
MVELIPTLAPVAAKLETVNNIAWITTLIGGICFAVGWGWIVFQMFRYSPVQGVLALIPPVALWQAFFRLEHAQKSQWVTASVAGAAIAGFGGMLLYSNMVCDADDACQPYTPPATNASPESGSGSETPPPAGSRGPSDAETAAFYDELLVTTC